MTEPRELVSIATACEIVHVSRRTIYNWLNAGKVEYVRTAGGSIRIYADSLFQSGAAPALSDNTTGTVNTR